MGHKGDHHVCTLCTSAAAVIVYAVTAVLLLLRKAPRPARIPREPSEMRDTRAKRKRAAISPALGALPASGPSQGGPSLASPPSMGKKKKGRRVATAEPDGVMEVLASLGLLTRAIEEANTHWTEVLGNLLYAHTEYAGHQLDKLYAYLSVNEMPGRRFVAMPEGARKRYIDGKIEAMEREMNGDSSGGDEGARGL